MDMGSLFGNMSGTILNYTGDPYVHPSGSRRKPNIDISSSCPDGFTYPCTVDLQTTKPATPLTEGSANEILGNLVDAANPA